MKTLEVKFKSIFLPCQGVKTDLGKKMTWLICAWTTNDERVMKIHKTMDKELTVRQDGDCSLAKNTQNAP